MGGVIVFNTKYDLCVIKDDRSEMPKGADVVLTINGTFLLSTTWLRNSLTLYRAS